VEHIEKAVEEGTINGKKLRYAASFFALNRSTAFYWMQRQKIKQNPS